MSVYCEIAPGHPWHGPYHDREYGFPLDDDAAFCERLALEIQQAGLSWLTVLKKREAIRRAFRGFEPGVVARFRERDVERLLADPGIIRNRKKIEAIVENARAFERIGRECGSFAAWMEVRHPASLDEWGALFRTNFRFTGREIVREFLLSTGYLPGAHAEWCPVAARVRECHPPWTRTG